MPPRPPREERSSQAPWLAVNGPGDLRLVCYACQTGTERGAGRSLSIHRDEWSPFKRFALIWLALIGGLGVYSFVGGAFSTNWDTWWATASATETAIASLALLGALLVLLGLAAKRFEEWRSDRASDRHRVG